MKVVKFLFSIGIFLALLLISNSCVFSQETTTEKKAHKKDLDRKNIVDVSPGMLVGIYQVGYERRMSNKISLEVRPSLINGTILEIQYDLFHLQMAANYYPLRKHRAPKGLYITPSFGLGSGKARYPNIEGSEKGGFFFTLGFGCGYQFIFRGGFSLDLGVDFLYVNYPGVQQDDAEKVGYAKFSPVFKIGLGYAF